MNKKKITHLEILFALIIVIAIILMNLIGTTTISDDSVNDDTITWEDIWNGMISSEFGAGVKHAEVFSKYDYKDGVDPDEVIPVDI